MPGKRATPAQKKRFWNLINTGGFSPRAAALKVGMSETWGWRMVNGLRDIEDHGAGNRAELDRTLQTEAPDPKTWDQLDGGVRDLLRPDGFNLFCEAVLCRRPAAWRQEAAKRLVGWLMDKSERTFVDANTPPGAGKSTLFTHDIEAWLICGGGFMDPALGRAIRILLGHESGKVSEHYVLRLRRLLELRRPYYDKEQKRQAELVLTDAFGRFRPLAAQGEESLWRNDQFLVAQLADVDLYEKEPTVQAASRQSGFLGERVDLEVWDDLATLKNARNPDIAEELDKWYQDEAETRVEPGGVGVLVGQRLSPIDLHAKRLSETYVDEDGEVQQLYKHIVFPVHHELTCDGNHRQWDLETDGCLLDEYRFPWKEVVKLSQRPNYRTVYQQEDVDPAQALVLGVWIDGGLDPFEFMAPGCWDRERNFLEVPSVAPKEKFINYACVDPAAGNWWAIEWWALLPGEGKNPHNWYRYLIWARRAKLSAGGPTGFLDWDNASQEHVGLMEETQRRSIELGMPIRAWVLEKNAAHRYLLQYDHFRRWKNKYPAVTVIPHETQKNKHDPQLGLEATLPMAYRNGLKRLPRAPGPDTLTYMRMKIKELTNYPQVDTWDTVMADWFGETNLESIWRIGSRPVTETPEIVPNLKLPPYLRRQRLEIAR